MKKFLAVPVALGLAFMVGCSDGNLAERTGTFVGADGSASVPAVCDVNINWGYGSSEGTTGPGTSINHRCGSAVATSEVCDVVMRGRAGSGLGVNQCRAFVRVPWSGAGDYTATYFLRVIIASNHLWGGMPPACRTGSDRKVMVCQWTRTHTYGPNPSLAVARVAPACAGLSPDAWAKLKPGSPCATQAARLKDRPDLTERYPALRQALKAMSQ